MTRALAAAAMLASVLLASAAQAAGLLIIANPSVPVDGPLPLTEIAAIYLLRVTSWPDGSHIVPVNRDAGSEARREFTARVLQQDNADLAVYWNEMHFMGKMPPLVQESQEAMIAFIRNVPGSLGYVTGSTPPPNVKLLAYVP